MRRALIISLIILSLAGVDPERAKSVLRRLAMAFTRVALSVLSRPYALGSGTAIVFAPHQDDETIGCGGLIARKRNEGLPVHVVFITDGSASHPHHPRHSTGEIAAMRHLEAREALAILGVESNAIHHLREPDGTLHQLTPDRRESLVSRIAAILSSIRPEEVFLPCQPDGSSEHDAAFSFVLEALERTRLRPTVWQYPVWSWWNPTLLLQRIFLDRARVRLPTEDYALIKRRALACYRSQMHPLAPQTQSALPGELSHVINGATEYFFGYAITAASSPSNAPRAIV